MYLWSHPPFHLLSLPIFLSLIYCSVVSLSRHLFYLQIKSLMAKGQLPIPVKEAPKFGALIAQSDFGNSSSLNNKLCYPQYFKDWAPGIARGIAKEHSKLSGKEPCTQDTLQESCV